MRRWMAAGICAGVVALTMAIGTAQELRTRDFDRQVSPWPEIRKERINTLLPKAMTRAGVDAWIVICRENNNDPLAIHVGGENAGGTAAVMFFLVNGRARSICVSPSGEATALKDLKWNDSVLVIGPGTTVWQMVSAHVHAYDPKRIAINSSKRAAADGLSYTERKDLEAALGNNFASRLVSSEDLVTQWLSLKLPDEISILRRAADVTALLEIEAYKKVIPGKTRDSDIARFLKRRMGDLGLEDGWAPDQNPNVNSGLDRGHSNATDRVIQPGDFIQTDFGIKVYGVWCTDIQRFAYVLAPGEVKPPADMLKKWENARQGSRIALAAMKPGVRGYDVDKAQRDWMGQTGSLPVPWGTGHPVGYWAHDLGPALSGAQSTKEPSGAATLLLEPGQVFAYDGFFCWKQDDGTKTISVEEMAVVTEKGAEYLIPPQQELVLIRSDR